MNSTLCAYIHEFWTIARVQQDLKIRTLVQQIYFESVASY
jgi:hypothetical protein